LGEKWTVNLACDPDFHVNRKDLLHAAKLRHGTDGFTSPPKEGMLWIFSPEKSNGFEPANLGTRGQHANHWTTEAAFGSLYLTCGVNDILPAFSTDEL
jgi:hypothetical protein